MSIIDYSNGSTNANARTLTDNSTQLRVISGTATQSGVISETGGSFGLEKIGAGTLIYTWDNTYTGVTTISGGTLQLGNGSSLLGSVSGNIVNNAALAFNYGTSAAVNYAGSITGTGSLTVDGGVISLTGDNNFSGGTTVISGGLWIGGAGGFGASTTTGSLTGNVSLPTLEFPDGTGTAYLGFGRSDDYTFSGNISGVGHVEAVGSGTLTLTGDNSAHTGYLVLEDGVLQVASDANLGGGLIRMGTGTLRFLASYTSNLSYELTGAAFDTNGHDIVLAGPLTADVNANTPFYGGVLKTGAGTLTLTGANTYTGDTTINGGTLAVSADSNLGAVNSGITLNGGTFRFLGSFNLNGARTIALDAAGGTIDTNGFSTSIGDNINNTGSVTISGAGSLTKNGQGYLFLSGTQTYSGGTILNDGAVQAVAGSLASTGGVAINGGLFDFVASNSISAQVIGALSGAGGMLALDSVALTTISDTDTSLAAAITGTGGLNKGGAGALTLTAANSYTGGTIISGGTLRLGPGGSLASTGALVVNGGTFDLNGHTQTVGPLSGSGGAIQLGSGSLTVTMANLAGAFSGVITGTGSLTKGGVATLTLNGTNTFTGGTTISAGVLQLGAGGSLSSTGALTVNAGAFDLAGHDQTVGALSGMGGAILTGGGYLSTVSNANTTLASAITGTGGLNKDGTGTLTLAGANTYTGGTTISAGTLKLGASNSLAANSSIAILGNAVLDLNNNDLTVSAVTGSAFGSVHLGSATLSIVFSGTQKFLDGVISGTGGLVKGGDGLLYVEQDNTYSGGTTISGGALMVGFYSTTGWIVGDVTDNATLIFNRSDSVTFSGSISGTGSVGQTGTGTLYLTGHNTYAGGTLISEEATLCIASASNIGSGDIQLYTSSSVLRFSASLSLAQNFQLRSGILSTDANSNVTLSGVITTMAGTSTAVGGFSKAGAGTLTLTNSNTYTGPTDVVAGSLLVNGSTASSTISVESGAILGGTGTVGTTFVKTGGKLAPGAGIGTLQVNGNLNLASGTTYAEDLSSATADEIMVTGNVSIAGDLAANFASGSYSHQSYTILHSSGTVSGTFANASISGLPAGMATILTYGAHDVTLTIDHAPTVTSTNKTLVQGHSLALSSLVSVTDADGDAMTEYQLWDATRDPNSGYFVVNGVAQAAGTVIDVTAAQLAQTSFVAGSVGDSLQIRAFDGYAWSAADNASWAPFTVTSSPDNPPVVTTSNKTMAVGATVALSSLFSVSDADGDSMTKYQIWDGTRDANAGYVTINGQAQPAAALIELTPTQLAQTSFVMGTVPTGLQIRAFDGVAWSAADNASWAPFTVSPPPNNAPVVTTSNRTLGFGTTVALSSLFSVSDADGDTMTRYQIWDGSHDPGAGYLTISGVQQPAGLIDITAAQLTQTSFVVGSVPTSLQIHAFDGRDWSAADNASWAPFTISAPANHAPVVTTSNKTMAVGATAALSTLFNVSDADGDAMTRYQIWDGSHDPSAGYVTIGGLQQPAGLIEVTAAQLGQTSFVMGNLPTGLQIRAFDGRDWSASDNASWAPFIISPPPNIPPVVTTSNKTMPAGATVALSGLFSAGDADGDAITKYQVWESTRDPNAGYVAINGNRQPAAALIEMTAAQMAQASFVVGTVATNLQIRAFDGKDWSAADNASWAPFNISPGTDHAPVVTTMDKSATAGQSFALSNLFNVTDADGDTMTKYQLWDGTSAATSGHFVVNGQAQSAGTLIEIGAAQLSQTSFVAGQSGASDSLQIRAFDGYAWSAGDSVAWSPFHINVS